MSDLPTYEFVATAMSTTISLQLVGELPDAPSRAADALGWFDLVERSCSRFDQSSELMRLTHTRDGFTPVSPLLFEVLRVARSVAEASDGAFDPAVGARVHALGFNRPWRGGAAIGLEPHDTDATWRDITLDDAACAVRLARPLQLDLGAIAKGFATDLAARALAAVAHCAINAGGDLLYRGRNAKGEPWRTAIVHPRDERARLATLTCDAAEFAVCTSGDYVRRTARGHHLVDPRQREATSASCSQSATVVAPQAAIADGLATAAFVLGPDAGAALLEAQGVDGCIVGADGAVHMARGWGCTEWSVGHE